jgi:hypothetical protein
MVSKCANPSCPTPFNYFNQGRLFEFDVDRIQKSCRDPAKSGFTDSRTRELFWLCGPCCLVMTLECTEEHGIRVVPLNDEQRQQRAA